MPPCFDWSGVTVQADQVHNHIDQDGSEAAKNTAHPTLHIAHIAHIAQCLATVVPCLCVDLLDD